MTLPDSPIHPTDPEPQAPGHPPERVEPSPARRRRARRNQILPADAEGRAAVAAALARRAYPTYELFVFAILCGAVLGLGYLLDSQAVLLFGILLAPLFTPWIGMTLALITGSARFFVETLVALLISAMLVFLSGLLAGLAARAFLPLTLNNAFDHSRLWIPDLIVLTIGAIVLTVSFVRSEEKPYLPSVMLAYSLFMPVSAAGFGLGSGVEGIWPHGLLVFVTYFALATLAGLVTLLALRFRPTAAGMLMSGSAGIVIVAALFLLMGPGLRSGKEAAVILPTFSPTQTIAVTPSPQLTLAATAIRSPKPSSTPHVQTATPFTASPVPLTLTLSLPITDTATITLTIEPTPVYARISSDTGGGVNLRKTPNGTYMATLDNGSIVQVLPDIQEVSGTAWAHVIAIKSGRQLEGWILQSVLSTATPVPNWQPSSTPTISAPDTATTAATATPTILDTATPTASETDTPTVSTTDIPTSAITP